MTSINLTGEEIADALERIGRSQDGKALRQLLMREIQTVISDVAPDGALRVHGARRNFATELLRKLDPVTDGNATDGSLIQPSRRPSGGTPGGIRRRVPEVAD